MCKASRGPLQLFGARICRPEELNSDGGIHVVYLGSFPGCKALMNKRDEIQLVGC